jgi:hypothetical protein
MPDYMISYTLLKHFWSNGIEQGHCGRKTGKKPYQDFFMFLIMQEWVEQLSAVCGFLKKPDYLCP